MDPQITINDVVNNVKSEGIFDQFRKECLEEFENMAKLEVFAQAKTVADSINVLIVNPPGTKRLETTYFPKQKIEESYNQLKQTVENHVASFLSKRRFSELLQKNLLRTELRNHLNKDEVLLNGIQRLVDEVLSLKGHGFCLKIDKQVDQFLNPQAAKVEHNGQSETIVSTAEIKANIPPSTISTIIDVQEIESPNEHKTSLEESSPINNPKDDETKGEHEIENNVELQETEIEEVEMELDENDEGMAHNNTVVVEKDSNGEMNHEFVTTNDPIKTNDSPPDKNEKENEGKGEKIETNNKEQSVGSTEAISSENEDEVVLEKKTENDPVSYVKEEKPENVEQVKKSLSPQNKKDSFEEGGSKTPTQDEEVMQSSDNENKFIDKNPQLNSYYTSLVTEPISDDSSNNSTPESFEPISEEDEENTRVSEPEDETDRRKSHRKRNIPLKLRGEEENEKAISKGIDKKRSNLRKTRSRDTDEKYREKSNDRSLSRSKERSHRKIEKSDSEKSRDRSRSKDRRNRKTERGRSSGAVKRPATPPEPEERFSKRPRRPTKQRERYSPS